MRVKCGCEFDEYYSGDYYTDSGRYVTEARWCKLHAHAAEMRELLKQADELFVVNYPKQIEWRLKARALLEETKHA